MNPRINFDIVIVGGGLVGMSLAVALSDSPHSVALIDKSPVSARGRDQRAIALALGSQQILQKLGIWAALADKAATISRVHISNQGRFGRAQLASQDSGTAQLGYVMRAGEGEMALLESLQGQKNLHFFAADEVLEATRQPSQTHIALRSGQSVSAKLLVAADGADSPLREKFQIPVVKRDYGQSAIISEVSPQFPTEGIAFERFTDDGPVALLPMLQNRYAVVCTVPNSQQNAVLSLPDEAFCHYLKQRFGERLGDFSHPAPRTAYPLRLLKAKRYIGPRFALVGNAAHTLHPIAGQGFNLGLRDVAVLANFLNVLPKNADVGEAKWLRNYEKQRQQDQQLLVNFTDGLAWLFTSRLPGVPLVRNLGLLAFDVLPPIKRQLARRAMGMF